MSDWHFEVISLTYEVWFVGLKCPASTITWTKQWQLQLRYHTVYVITLQPYLKVMFNSSISFRYSLYIFLQYCVSTKSLILQQPFLSLFHWWLTIKHLFGSLYFDWLSNCILLFINLILVSPLTEHNSIQVPLVVLLATIYSTQKY